MSWMTWRVWEETRQVRRMYREVVAEENEDECKEDEGVVSGWCQRALL